MILAQRAPVAGSYDYSAFTRRGEPRVLRYWLKDPNDPPTPGLWKPMPEEYAVGFAGNYRNTNGGVALGYGYRPGRHARHATSCEARSGPRARISATTRRCAASSNPAVRCWCTACKAARRITVRSANEPPAISYFVDYDDKFDDPRASGHMGSVRIYTQPCAAPTAYGGPGYAGSPPYIFAGGGRPHGPPPPPPPNKLCTASGTFECVKGHWVYKLTVTGPGWINSATTASLNPPVSFASGPFTLNPATIPVTGPPGSTATIEVCAFDAAAAASGKPYDCCRTTVKVTIPTTECGIIK